ncbi:MULTISPECIES: gluconokinase [unclassified Mesorhizobium]|uniref:gluconokinase n=1 Tax=unclassified Mesorhizobium TaxID=325217 RepID=UPI002417D71F|nr:MULTISPECIES: gluconokinase [unclassified Mesorhizobium]WFP66060.1 gluconokinase [Mesorhizobium sp. WSM4904]WFP79343.1 gluconokinase [Mesorhizobium sp. WSM4906]
MGVAGCGKTVVGEALAEALGAVFIEGDRLHPPENVARMARGEPLTDALREGWLDAIGERIAASVADGRKAVAACSALKRSYRDRLRGFCPGIVFLYLKIDRETAWSRVANRKGHFMPASLVDSQFSTLEEPGPDEFAVTVDATRTVAAIVKEVLG